MIAESGRKRADSFINRASAAAVKGGAEMCPSRLLSQAGTGVLAPSEALQHVGGGKSVRWGADRGLEAAQGFPGLPAELAVGGAAVEAALDQKLLQFQPLGARQHPFLPRPRLHERRPAAQAVGKMADCQRIGLRRV